MKKTGDTIVWLSTIDMPKLPHITRVRVKIKIPLSVILYSYCHRDHLFTLLCRRADIWALK